MPEQPQTATVFFVSPDDPRVRDHRVLGRPAWVLCHICDVERVLIAGSVDPSEAECTACHAEVLSW